MWQTELSGQVGSIKIEWRSENGLSRSLSPAQLFRTDSEVTRIEYNLKSLQENWVFVMSLGNFSLDFRFPGINSNDWLFQPMLQWISRLYSILLESSQLSQFWPKNVNLLSKFPMWSQTHRQNDQYDPNYMGKKLSHELSKMNYFDKNLKFFVKGPELWNSQKWRHTVLTHFV